jgi:hypothetical protein
MKHGAQHRAGEAGTTLIEVLIAVTLLSLLSVGILMALRVGISAMGTANARLMETRRVAGAQRIIEQQIEGFMPVTAPCAPGGDTPSPGRIIFFQGEPQSMRFVSTFSLQEAWRGTPRILEFQVVPGEQRRGVRLIVNELPYTGPFGAGLLCVSRNLDPTLGLPVARFAPIEPGPRSFVLADRLASCRFVFLAPAIPPEQPVERWMQMWTLSIWPRGVRIEMAPLDAESARLRPVTVTVPLHIDRHPEIKYVDY